MTTKSLNILDFSTGIRSNLINANFSLIKEWIDAERLRIGGWGIVNGFDLSKNLEDYTIIIGKGVIINEQGEEITVDPHVELVGPPIFDRALNENCIVDDEGKIVLNFPIYSSTLRHTLYYDKGDSNSDISQIELGDLLTKGEFSIVVSDTELKLTAADIMSIDGGTIYISGAKYGGQNVKVTYDHADDRIDAIMLKKDGSEYKYVKELISTSPSQAVIEDYLENGWYLIGMAYWHVGHTVDVEFITLDRTYRKIFVDSNGILYINGKRYMDQKFIYFKEPNPREEYDLWYNTEEDILYICRYDENRNLIWKPVNDLSRSVTDSYTFLPEQNPQDLQTFSFEDSANLRFIPGLHQLTIIIDQIVLMEDQYIELYKEGGEKYASGYGFKLNYPLERASVVEVRIDHNVIINAALKDLFQHISTLIDEGSFTMTTQMITDKVKTFSTTRDFELGQKQLEVYLNGTKLIADKDFTEGPSSYNGDPLTSINASAKLSNSFIVNKTLKATDVIAYRITRCMANYDNLTAVTDELKSLVQKCHNEVQTLDSDIKNLADNTASINTRYDSFISETNNTLQSLKTSKVNVSDVIKTQNIDEAVTSHVINSQINKVEPITSPSIYLSDVTVNDFIIVCYAKNDSADLIPLMENHDYTIAKLSSGIDIDLLPKWTGIDGAKLYIKGFKIGL